MAVRWMKLERIKSKFPLRIHGSAPFDGVESQKSKDEGYSRKSKLSLNP